MEHYKSRDNDFFHFTNPLDDVSEFDDDDDYHQLQYYDVDVDDDRSCDFNFHPLGITQSPSPGFQTSGVMNQNDDVEEFGRFDNGALIGQLDNTMKKLSDKLQHSIVGIGAKISRLEDETCKLDKYVENVKNSEDTYHGMTHRKLRQMQTILQEVQDDVLFLRDKHEIAEMQLQLAKLQGLRRDKITMNPQQHVPLPAPQSSCVTPFAACLNHLPSNEVNLSEAVFYHPTAPQAPEITVQKYLIPPNPSPHKNQPEPLFPNFTQSYQPNSFQGVGSPQSHPFMSHHSYETPNVPSCNHSSSLQHFPSDPAIWDSTQEHKVSLPQSTHVQPPRNHKYMPKFAIYSDTQHHGKLPSSHESSSLNSQEQSSISNYTKTPLPQALPHALPTAIDVEDGSSSEENANTILVDDIVDKVTAMGFRRDRVRASMRKMTQNGSPVDLNSVLDSMMNNK